LTWAKRLVSKAPPPKSFSDEEIDAIREAARKMYEAAPSRPHSPAWEQLSEVTQSVWIGRIAKEAGWNC
jgi:hypothetical protein